MALLKVKNLKTYFWRNQGTLSKIVGERGEVVQAVDNVTFDVEESEIVGIVGETGCGKTTLGKTILLLVRPKEGEIFFEKQNILQAKSKVIHGLRRQMQMVFQDSIGSLNPKMKVKDAIAEPLKAYKILNDRKELNEKVATLLKTVDLSPEYGDKYPFQLSGGEGRRVTIARSLALRPKLIVCDEPTSGLDVSVSAKVLNVMKEIHDEFKLAYIWISHNLHVINYVSHKILVMYLGKIVESGHTSDVFKKPSHPYTKALLLALPRLEANDISTQKRIHLKGEVPSPISPPPGCRFAARCAESDKECEEVEPKLITIEKGHQVACLKYDK